MLVHVSREYGINKILLSLVGLWPFRNKIIRCLLLTTHLLVILTICPFEVLMLFDHWNNKNTVFECFYHLVVIINILLKLLCLFWYQNMIRRLYGAIENHWNVFTSETEVQILKHYSHISRTLTLFYSIIMYLILTIFSITSLAPMFLDIIRPLNESRARISIVAIDWRVDEDKYFVPINCYILLFLTSGISIIISTDTMHITCTAHACSLFSIISQHLKNMKSNKTYDILKKRIREQESMNIECKLLDEQVMYQEYIICLKKYQLALQYVDILNSAFRTIALIMLLVSVAILSLVGIRIVYIIHQLEEVVKYSFVIACMLMQLLVLCYTGQKLMDKSQNVFYYAYAAEWYKFPPKIKSLLIITLQRSFVPCTLTAGNIFTLSMVTYTTVVQAGLSYFMTFLSIKD